jgi:hypothetical protein
MADELHDMVNAAKLADDARRWRENETRRQREAAARPTLDAFAVNWEAITPGDVEAFSQVLTDATDESTMQQYLQAHPQLLAQHLGGGHGRWVIPEAQLGSQLRVDFMIAEASSVGFEWTAVELESPQRRMFNRNGDVNQWLNHAIRQILDARTWLMQNLPYANNPRDRHGLGLVDADGTVPGLIIIGRRADLAPDTRLRRRQLMHEHNIKIHSYDWLLTNASDRCEQLRRHI